MKKHEHETYGMLSFSGKNRNSTFVVYSKEILQLLAVVALMHHQYFSIC